MVQMYDYEEGYGVTPHRNGEFVLYSDYATLESENANYKDTNSHLEGRLIHQLSINDHMDRRMTALEHENALLRKVAEKSSLVMLNWDSATPFEEALEYISFHMEDLRPLLSAWRNSRGTN